MRFLSSKQFAPIASVVGRVFPRETAMGDWLRRGYHHLTPEQARPRFPAMLSAFAAQIKPVFFVQVGSNDGGGGDPIRPFIDHRGWSGILIEPVPHIFRRLVERYSDRPGLAFENVAIADQEGEQPFYILRPSSEPGLPPWYEMLGSFSKANILKHAVTVPDIAERIIAIQVPCTTLSTLLSKHAVQRVDVLHVDAEGYDFEVIRRYDFARYRPAIVLYEHKHLSADDSAACTQLLGGLGYRLMPDLADTLAVHESLFAPGSLVDQAWQRITAARR